MNETRLHPSHGPSCDDFAPMISAWVDGELASYEQDELQSHLDDCSSCQHQLRLFKQIDAAVGSLSDPRPLTGESVTSMNGQTSLSLERSAIPSMSKAAPVPPVKTKRPSKNWMTSGWRIVPIAAAATILVCLAIVAFPSPREASADLISHEQIVQPMKDLLLINLHQQRDQDLMLRTLEMDLRSLKIDAAQIDSEPNGRLALEAKINALIEKVNHFGSTHDQTITPNE